LSTAAAAIRQVEVVPLSARAELAHVVRVGLAIVVAATVYLSLHSSLFAGDPATRQLLPFQKLAMSRPESEQKMFVDIQEGLLEAENRRSTSGAWPTVAELAGDGVPPFTFDPTNRGAKYAWTLIREGAYVNYLGLPDRSSAPAWLLLVQEPEPGASSNLVRQDQEHHRLLDGTMLQVSTWVREDGRVAKRLINTPQAEGWTELLAVEPSAAPSR
jgi:Family of unknown function (DUF6162)